MTFLAPIAFAIAAAAVPALLLLYFLKLRRREEVVPSTLLWKRAVQDLQVNAPFQKLRKNLLLLLQLLVLLAGIFALARPIIKSTATDEASLVILLDRSASMNAREGDQTRLELGKEQAVRLVKTINRSGSNWFGFVGVTDLTRVMVIAFAERATVVSPFTTNMNELADLIDAIEPTDAQTNMNEALDLAEAYMMPTRGEVERTPVSSAVESKLVLISDGGVSGLEDRVLRGGTMEMIRIGETGDNVAITALRTQRSYERPAVLNVFVQVQNFGPEPVTTDVSLFIETDLGGQPRRQLAKVKPISLGPAAALETTQPAAGAENAPARSSAASLSFELELEQGALIEARLSRDDALDVDNRVFAVVPPARKQRVLLVTEGNFFLETVLGNLPLDPPDPDKPNEGYASMTPEEYEAAPSKQIEADGRSIFDVVVFDKHDTARLPSGNYLFLRSVPKIENVKAVGELESHRMMWWDDTHPVLRHVALAYVDVFKGLALELPEEAEMLIEGPQGAVMARYAKDGRHYIIVSFAVESSTWWSKTSFPVFAYNVIRYLGSGGSITEQDPTRPGEALAIPIPAGSDSTRLTPPKGDPVTLRADAANMARFAGTHTAGVYRVAPAVEGGEAFAVNLEDPWESDIRPRGLTIGGMPVEQGNAIQTSNPEVWRWFVGTALLIALLEWYIYNRRVMI